MNFFCPSVLLYHQMVALIVGRVHAIDRLSFSFIDGINCHECWRMCRDEELSSERCK